MRALFRYLVLKNGREGWLPGLVIGPSMMLLSPFLVLAVYLIVRGSFAWPMPLDRNSAAGLEGIPEFLVMVAALVAASVAFFAFAGEAANKAIGSFLLAVPAERIVLVSVLFGAVGAITGALVAQLAVALIKVSITTTYPPGVSEGFLMMVARILLVSVCGASAGIAMLSVSAMPTMVVPAHAIALASGFLLMKRFDAGTVAIVLVLTGILLSVATWCMRRRCAV